MRRTPGRKQLWALRDGGVWLACTCDQPGPRAHRWACQVTRALTAEEDLAALRAEIARLRRKVARLRRVVATLRARKRKAAA